MAEQSLEEAQRYFFIALGIDMAVTAVSVASDFWAIDVLKTIAASGSTGSQSDFAYMEFWEKFAVVMVLTTVGVGWTLTRWVGACYVHARQTLGATGFHHEKWKTTGWIFPFLNLFKPYQVLSEIYRVGASSGTQSDDWKKTSGSGVLLTWWVFWIISHLVMMSVFKAAVRKPTPESPTLTQVFDAYYIAITFSVLSLIIAGLWFVVAGNLTKRLLERSDRPFKPVPLANNAVHAAPASNDAYAAALAEIEEGRLDKGVWARSFADSGGDESKAKAAYIKARAESLKGAGVDSVRVLPETKSVGLYEAAIGEKSQAYYVAAFDSLDQGAHGLNPSWNWAAFLFTGGWALYRKMYGWFFICVAVTVVGGLLYRSRGSEAFALISLSVAWVGFAVYANSIYHHKVKANISAAQKSISDPSKLAAFLSSEGGVHAWVPPIVGAIPVVGIVAAVALPAYQDYTRRQATQGKTWLEKAHTLQARVRSGELVSINGITSNSVRDGLVVWPSSESAELERSQAWWLESGNHFNIHLRNTTSRDLTAVGLRFRDTTCERTGSTSNNFFVFFSPPIGPGSEAVVVFKPEIAVGANPEMCLEVFSAWQPRESSPNSHSQPSAVLVPFHGKLDDVPTQTNTGSGTSGSTTSAVQLETAVMAIEREIAAAYNSRMLPAVADIELRYSVFRTEAGGAALQRLKQKIDAKMAGFVRPNSPPSTQIAAPSNQAAPQRRFSAQVQADLNRIAERATKDYPYLDTPAGQEVLDKIIKRRDVLIEQGEYPSIALTRAINDFAPAYAPSTGQENRPKPVDAAPATTSNMGNHPGFAPECRWVTPQKWSCK